MGWQILKKKKKQFEVLENETVDECLDRMKKEGYVPVAKREKPIFQEVVDEKGEIQYKPVRQKIIFEGRLLD